MVRRVARICAIVTTVANDDDDDAAVLAKLRLLEQEVRQESAAKAAHARSSSLANSPGNSSALGQVETSPHHAHRAAGAAPTKPHAAERTHRDALGDAVAREVERRIKADVALTAVPQRKSVLASAGLSVALGPLGWFYAGSYWDAVPAGLAWLIIAYLARGLPMLLLMPVWLAAALASGAAGAVYALSYNRQGTRLRMLREYLPRWLGGRKGDAAALAAARTHALSDGTAGRQRPAPTKKRR